MPCEAVGHVCQRGYGRLVARLALVLGGLGEEVE